MCRRRGEKRALASAEKVDGDRDGGHLVEQRESDADSEAVAKRKRFCAQWGNMRERHVQLYEKDRGHTWILMF